MQNLTLPADLPNKPGKSWTQESPDGSIDQANESWGADFGQKVLNIWINGRADNVREAIKYIVGYSSSISTVTGALFDTTNVAKQGPFRLDRQTPARHPQYPNLRATKILNVQGTGLRTDTKDGKQPVAFGSW